MYDFYFAILSDTDIFEDLNEEYFLGFFDGFFKMADVFGVEVDMNRRWAAMGLDS